MNSKRLTALLLAALMVLTVALTGCSGGAGGSEGSGEPAKTEESSAPEIPGLTFESELELKRATEFSVYHYADGYDHNRAPEAVQQDIPCGDSGDGDVRFDGCP